MCKIEDNNSSNSQLELPKADNEHIENAAPNDVDDEIITRFLGASDEVKEGEKQEKEMGFKAAIKAYPKCAVWSVVLSTGIIMEGYDTCLGNAMYALPIFCERFGRANIAFNKQVS